MWQAISSLLWEHHRVYLANLDSRACYTPRLCGTAYCFQATNLCSVMLSWILQAAVIQCKDLCNKHRESTVKIQNCSLMGPPAYMWAVTDWNPVMWHATIYPSLGIWLILLFRPFLVALTKFLMRLDRKVLGDEIDLFPWTTIPDSTLGRGMGGAAGPLSSFPRRGKETGIRITRGSCWQSP